MFKALFAFMFLDHRILWSVLLLIAWGTLIGVGVGYWLGRGPSPDPNIETQHVDCVCVDLVCEVVD